VEKSRCLWLGEQASQRFEAQPDEAQGTLLVDDVVAGSGFGDEAVDEQLEAGVNRRVQLETGGTTQRLVSKQSSELRLRFGVGGHEAAGRV
jgi:hypothetical protein